MGGQQSVSHFFSSQSHHVVMVGLDGAGKTTGMTSYILD